MKTVTVVVSSITHALRGEKLLREAGYQVRIERDTARFGKYGCGYCLRIAGDCGAAIELLRQQHVKMREEIWE